jgi:hypothetical protein
MASAIPPWRCSALVIWQKCHFSLKSFCSSVLPFMQRMLGVHHDQFPRIRSGGDNDPGGGNVGRPRTDHRDPGLIQFLAHDLQGIDQPRQSHGRGSLLVVMPHRNLGFLPEGIENMKALGLG